MANVCAKCSTTLTLRNRRFYNGQDLCNVCLRGIEENEQGALLAASGASGPQGSSVIGRYQDAYRVAAALVGLGGAIKIIGGVLATVIVLGALASADGRLAGAALLLPAVFMAALIGIVFWVCGVMVSAQGQILRATLDSAVASSPFLSISERATAMGLPISLAGRELTTDAI